LLHISWFFSRLFVLFDEKFLKLLIWLDSQLLDYKFHFFEQCMSGLQPNQLESQHIELRVQLTVNVKLLTNFAQPLHRFAHLPNRLKLFKQSLHLFIRSHQFLSCVRFNFIP
jgi:hypothetical protein